jgi:hypothetical protein
MSHNECVNIKIAGTLSDGNSYEFVLPPPGEDQFLGTVAVMI